jgi:hypothetical protein
MVSSLDREWRGNDAWLPSRFMACYNSHECLSLYQARRLLLCTQLRDLISSPPLASSTAKIIWYTSMGYAHRHASTL